MVLYKDVGGSIDLYIEEFRRIQHPFAQVALMEGFHRCLLHLDGLHLGHTQHVVADFLMEALDQASASSDPAQQVLLLATIHQMQLTHALRFYRLSQKHKVLDALAEAAERYTLSQEKLSGYGIVDTVASFVQFKEGELAATTGDISFRALEFLIEIEAWQTIQKIICDPRQSVPDELLKHALKAMDRAWQRGKRELLEYITIIQHHRGWTPLDYRH